jgi:Uma2 family endonuclease
MSGMAQPQETYQIEEWQPRPAGILYQAGRPVLMTYEEFLDWADEDTHAEWVDGVVIMTSPVSARHQDIADFLVAILSTFAQLHSLGKILNGPFQMKLAHTGREPDVLFLAKAHLGRLKKTYVDGPADLAIEIISPESQERDRSTKLYEYQDAGVPEYWLIDPELEEARFYQLDDAGHYQLVNPDENGIYRSQVLPDFWLRVPWLWQETLPDTIQALLEIDRDTYARYLREQMRQAGLE